MKCYATQIGNCGGGLSKEHYISASVLKIAGSSIEIAGFPWQQRDEVSRLSVSALTARILCKHHNEQLSSLDAVAKHFLIGLKATSDEITQGELSHSTFQLSGLDLELWFLKVLIGVLSMRRIDVPPTWVNILFRRESWSEGSGLYFFGAPGEARWRFQLVRMILVKLTGDPARIAGAKFGIGGLAMLLSFGTPRFAECGMESLYRPKSLTFEKNAKQNTFNLDWNDQLPHGSVVLRETTPSSKSDPARHIVAPFDKFTG